MDPVEETKQEEQSTQDPQEDAFDAAFAEFTETPKVQDTDQKTEAASPEVTEEAPVIEEPAKKEEAKDPDQTPPDDEKDIPAEQLQSYRSWKGRLKADEERIKAERQALADERSKLEEERTKREQETKKVQDEETDKAIEQAVASITEQFEVDEKFIDPLKTIIAKTVEKSLKGIQPTAATQDGLPKSSAELQEIINKAVHNTTLLSHHPDIAEINKSSEFNAWIQSHPQSAEFQQIRQRGFAHQVVQMMNLYKNDRSKQKTVTEKAQSIQAVKTGNPPPVPRATIAKDDFDGAFEHFTKEFEKEKPQGRGFI